MKLTAWEWNVLLGKYLRQEANTVRWPSKANTARWPSKANTVRWPSKANTDRCLQKLILPGGLQDKWDNPSSVHHTEKYSEVSLHIPMKAIIVLCITFLRTVPLKRTLSVLTDHISTAHVEAKSISSEIF
jgi:hypothetical protein